MDVVEMEARRKRGGAEEAGEAGTAVPPASKRLASSVLAVPLGPPSMTADSAALAAEMQDAKRQLRALEEYIGQVKARAERAETELAQALSLAARPPAPSAAQLQLLAREHGWRLAPA
jgi:hypothetical protein